ncbi:MAG TPA: TAT-variant-translocated molybdopterin oxidoreductase [Chitinophagales bacterium]|nr:TAT-variant-translocated molybdopterin oxidoreductase [Chitinophagales bacterium]
MKYWKSLEEKEGKVTPSQANEFSEELPVISNLEKSGTLTSTRRDFLKMMGFSVTAAAVAASCEVPVRKSIPYVIKPDEIVPGVANYYASTYAEGGDYVSVLVKTREGRPIKIEGNKLSKITHGGTSAVAQASVLGLYDNYRLKKPLAQGEETSWKKVDEAIISELEIINAKPGNKIRILSSTILSPSTKQAIRDFIAKYPNTKHVTYDAISYSAMLKANEAMFGKKVIPNYQFDKADLIVSMGADFLGTWLSPVEFATQYGKRRKVSKENTAMNRHIQVESYLSLSGSNADKRIMVKPSELAGTLLHLYNVVASKTGGAAAAHLQLDENVKSEISKIADELLAAKGKSLVVCGLNDVNAQLITNAINHLLGNYNATIDFTAFSNQRQGDDDAMNELVKELPSVDALIIIDANPLYNFPGSEKFKEGLAKVSLTVSMNSKNDETTLLCKYVCPDHHYLESWNDAEPKNGSFSLTQPTIAPLFKTRSAAESLLKWAGMDTPYYEYIRNYWNQNIFPKQTRFASFHVMWDRALHDGVFELQPADEMLTVQPVDISAAGAALAKSQPGDGWELVVYESVAIRDGKFADNPWLQELPDPMTKVAWDNYACVSKKTAEQLGLHLALGKFEKSVGWETDVVKVSANGYEVTLPAIVQPGTPDNTIAIALGYGRELKARKGMSGIGKNAFPFLKDNASRNFIGGVSVSVVPGAYRIAQTQMHHSIHDGLQERRLVKETTLAEYKSNPAAGNEDREEVKKHLKSIYPEHRSLKSGLQWEMAIDLNSCIGCSACVVACTAENNVPVVGKLEVSRSREMHWLRIDRYFAGDESNPSVVFQPMLCQHCDNAPCENVCPVAATNHSSDGINQMAYNRCIGTRYCANNCPYKVRRFNWFDYLGADSFLKGTIFNNDKDEHEMTENLTRMVLNPDVNVRSRGVMEKCSFCIQRIQDGKLKAKMENRPLRDDDIATACQQACPTQAITFGDINNDRTEVYKLAHDERGFKVLEEIHTLPSITYLTKVRNKANEEV